MSTTTATPTATCPTCHGDVIQPRTGRRRTYCTTECWKEMRSAINDYHALERELVDTTRARDQATSAMWRARHERFLSGIRLALDEARLRVPKELR